MIRSHSTPCMHAIVTQSTSLTPRLAFFSASDCRPFGSPSVCPARLTWRVQLHDSGTARGRERPRPASRRWISTLIRRRGLRTGFVAHSLTHCSKSSSWCERPFGYATSYICATAAARIRAALKSTTGGSTMVKWDCCHDRRNHAALSVAKTYCRTPRFRSASMVRTKRSVIPRAHHRYFERESRPRGHYMPTCVIAFELVYRLGFVERRLQDLQPPQHRTCARARRAGQAPLRACTYSPPNQDRLRRENSILHKTPKFHSLSAFRRRQRPSNAQPLQVTGGP